MADVINFLRTHFSTPEEVITASSVPLENTLFEELENFLDIAEDELDLFQQCLDCQDYTEQIKTMGAIAFLEALQASQTPQESWPVVFEKGFYKNWLQYIYDSCSELRIFNSENHEKEIQEFSQLDFQQQEVARKRLRKLHADSWREWSEQPSARKQISLLDAENKKQRKHKEIREFIKEAAELVSILKPCWLMSPLAVSQYIPLQAICFDVVIFDEASQIRTEDAVPAIMRSKQVIVVGDSQQLPPTSFFASITSDDEDEEDDDEDAYENLLDECGKFMKSFTLQWHYRSQDESLIAFSNEKFYDSQLISFPNPVKASDRGVYFHYVEGAIYDRSSKKRINEKEAQEVAQLALNHIHDNGEQSLGIIAFSKDQTDAIRRQIEQLSAKSPELKEFCQEDSDKFFLKNLENVQGDERDVVIISFGYGKDKRGTFIQNFGPLNKSGGDRRLNVAITRAKYKLVLVASIRYEELKPEGKSRAVGLFKEYIEYAKDIRQEISGNSNSSEHCFTSPLLEDVYQALQERQYVVKSSVGRSDYPIELAVINDHRTEELLLGIECDGEIYRKYATARDRDRLRQLVLEKLGWKIHKIWSKDWFDDKNAQLNRLIAKLEQNRT